MNPWSACVPRTATSPLSVRTPLLKALSLSYCSSTLSFSPSCSSILAVGLYNLVVNGVTVLEGISPHHIVAFFARHGSEAWRMLGGVMLCFTGVEAMFADLGHFSLPAIRVSSEQEVVHGLWG